MKIISKKYAAGFTLIETLLYISIAGIMLLSISFFISILLQARIKNQVMAEVEQNGVQIMQIIERTIRNSETITLPERTDSLDYCTLDVVETSKDPTSFWLWGSAICMIESSSGSIITLTSNKVAASEVSFSNLSIPNTPGIMHFQFKLSYKNPSGRNEYNYSKTFYGSASLR